MAEITRVGTPSLTSVKAVHDNTHNVSSGIKAGEAIAAGDACYIASTGRAMKSTGAAATAPAQVHGFAAGPAALGEAITLLDNVEFQISGGALTPGAKLFLSGTVAGGLADVASTGGTGTIGFVCHDGIRVRVFGSKY